MSFSRHSAFSSYLNPFPCPSESASAVRNLLLLPEIFPLRSAQGQDDRCGPPLRSRPQNAVTLVSSLRTSICPASGSRRPLHPVFPELRDSALPADLSRGHRESAQSSAPANYGRLQECTS